ncbi:MAG: hypothetical protein ACTSVI_00830 [Promethearchaeota archaeon]
MTINVLNPRREIIITNGGRKSTSKINAIIILTLMVFQFVSLIPFFNPQLKSHPSNVPFQDNTLWENSIFTSNFPATFNVSSTPEFKARKAMVLNYSSAPGTSCQVGKIYLNLSVNEDKIRNAIPSINEFKDCSEFSLNRLLRILYLDEKRSILSPDIKSELKNAILNYKYWHTEPDTIANSTQIMWTENHQIQYHAAELLAGQLFLNETFPNSGMKGTDHVLHAIPMILEWLNWKGQFGFTETHSLTYYSIDILALVNLIDFAKNQEIVNKSAMVLDLITFDFANLYFKGAYATAHGRAYERNKVGTSVDDLPDRANTDDVAWLLLGIGQIEPGNTISSSALAMATSDIYEPPSILEYIANNASNFYECKDRNGINVEEGYKYGFGFEEKDLMFWWHMAAQIAPPVIKTSFEVINKYNINPEVAIGSQAIINAFQVGSFVHGTSLQGYSELIHQLSLGVALEAFNTYTYRTAHYQLSGVQDYQKGMNGLQEHVWQASLDSYATVWTNWDGLLSFKGGKFIGGWKPRATLYKNVGIIQYDRELMPMELEIGSIFFDAIKHVNGTIFPPIHAYFPRWAFDKVETRGKWIFGEKNGGYIALYSYEPVEWASNIELRVKNNVRKNAWIVELGSIDEQGSFEDFISKILESRVIILQKSIGYEIQYESPSRGLVHVNWDGPMLVNGSKVDLGPYPRFQNPYCHQEFGTNVTMIHMENQVLKLDFNTATRVMYNSSG